MLEVIQNIQESGYLPEWITFLYQSAGGEEKHIRFHERRTSAADRGNHKWR